MTSRYLAGLNQSVRDEMGVVRLFNLEDSRQYALMAEKRVLRYGARRPMFGRGGTSQGTIDTARGFRSDQIAPRNGRGGGPQSAISGGSVAQFERNDKRKNVVRFGQQNSAGSGALKLGNGSQIRCFTCGERGHSSYKCPHKRINIAEKEKG